MFYVEEDDRLNVNLLCGSFTQSGWRTCYKLNLGLDEPTTSYDHEYVINISFRFLIKYICTLQDIYNARNISV